MHGAVDNHGGITWLIGVFFWVVITIGIVVFIKSVFKSTSTDEE